jgi:hypothetical protein
MLLEIFAMQDEIRGAVGNNLATRALAWAGGQITTMELYQDLKSFADELDVPYSIPVK